MKKMHYKTIVLSDVHAGSHWSKCYAATQFLQENSCDTLILCGDIIDGWAIMRGKGSKWNQEHTDFIKTILDLQHTCRILYVRGNHDDFLDRITPLFLGNISIVKDYVYTSCGKRYYLLHGDIFDTVTSSMRWLARIGDIGYSILLWMNRFYNRYRKRRGLPYYSIAREIKQRVKASVSYISNFEKHIVEVAMARGCDGVICGHIHHPEISSYQGITYLNAGDWVESLSALTEDIAGNWSIAFFENESIEKDPKTILLTPEEKNIAS